MKERAAKEAASGRKITGPKPSPNPARRQSPRRANTTDPHSRIISTGGRGVLQGYHAQAAATVQQVVFAAEVQETPTEQTSYVPMAHTAPDKPAKPRPPPGVGPEGR